MNLLMIIGLVLLGASLGVFLVAGLPALFWLGFLSAYLVSGAILVVLCLTAPNEEDL
jgi:hypothetical protein